MAKKIDNTEEKIHAVEEALSRTESFIEKNQKLLLIIIGSISLVVLGVFAFQRFYLEPREKSAQEQMFMAQKYFEQDSLNKALNGDVNYPGFLGIIEDYGMTKASNLSKYYAGIIYLKQKKYQEAIEHLKKFKSDEEFVSTMALGGIGDAYLELGNKEDALDYYLKAASNSSNDLTSPVYLMRAAFVYEDMKQYDKAIEMYKRIQNDHPKSPESREVDKYISVAETKK